MANVIDVGICAFPKDYIARLSIGFAYGGAILVEACGVRVVRIYAHARNMVVHPIHKSRAVEAAVAIPILASPNVFGANILFSVYNNIGECRIGVVPSASLHKFRVGGGELIFGKDIFSGNVQMCAGIGWGYRGISS